MPTKRRRTSHEADDAKEKGKKELRKRIRIAEINLDDLKPQEKEQLMLLKTIAFVFYKEPDHYEGDLPLKNENGIALSRYERKPEPTVSLNYTIGELKDGSTTLKKRNKDGEIVQSKSTLLANWPKSHNVWPIQSINDLGQWKEILPKYGIEYQVSDGKNEKYKIEDNGKLKNVVKSKYEEYESKTISLDPVTLNAFLETCEPYIRALKAREKAKKEIDSQGERADSYLVANIRSIRELCTPFCRNL